MENPLPLAPDGLTRGVRIGRHAAGVLLILPIIIGLLAPFSVAFFLSSFETAKMATFYTVKSILCSFLSLIAYFLLWRIASDAPTKKSMLLLGASVLIPSLLSVYSLLCSILFNSELLHFDSRMFPFVYWGIISLVAVYALSLLLRNRRLGASDRSWIGLLAISECSTIIIDCFWGIGSDYLAAFDLPWSHMWSNSRYYQIFSYGWIILHIIAVWRLAHCPLFAGRREATEPLPAGFYSPLNRYMAAVVIASAVAVGALTLLYANAAQIVG